MKKVLLYSIIWIASLLIPVHAQQMHCTMIRLPEAALWQNSTTAVLGRVVTAQSFFNSTRTRIYTRYKLEVEEVFKGNPGAMLEIICEGGQVDNLALEFSDRIDLFPGNQVALALAEVPKHWTGLGNTSQAFAVYASLQGVFHVDEFGQLEDVFHRYHRLSDLRRDLQTITGNASRIMGQPSAFLPHVDATAAAVVSGLSPSTIPAGEGNVLTITGSGFGAVQGAGFVSFTAANGSVLRPLASDYVSWTDTEIRVKVPSRLINGSADNAAATGPVSVTPAGGVAVNAGNITVPYAFFNAVNSSSNAVLMNIAGPNASGGITLTYQSAFAANTAAVAAFERALDTWRCASGINISVGPGTTEVNVISADEINIVTFDDASPLDPGVGGRAENWVFTCIQNGQAKAVTVQVDIRFDNAAGGFTWNFGPAAPAANAVDFQTVALHEIGHNVQLAHTRSSSPEVMAAQASVGTSRRSLTANDVTAAQIVVQRSIASTSCNFPIHQANLPLMSISATTAMPVCSNGTIGFAAQTGVYNPSSLVWRVNGTNQSAGAGTPSFTYAAPQNNAQITCGIAGCSATVSNAITTSVQSLANASFAYSSTSVCGSQTTTVAPSSIVTPGGTFTSAPAGLSLNSSTGVIQPSASIAGNYTVTYTLAASGPCPSVSFNRTITIVAPPSSPTSITGIATGNCAGSRNFSCTAVAGASTYQWAIPSTTTITGTSNTNAVTVNFPSTFTSGTVSVSAVSSSGCVSAPRSLSVSGTPAQPGSIQITSINTVARTATCTTAAITGATSFQWTITNGTIISGQGTRTVQVSANVGATSVTACVRSKNTCGTSAQTCRTVSFPIIQQWEEPSTKTETVHAQARMTTPQLFPNPVSDLVQLQFDADWDNREIQIDLIDIHGRAESTARFVSEASAMVQFTTAHLQPGLYVLRIQSGDAMQSLRFVKH